MENETLEKALRLACQELAVYEAHGSDQPEVIYNDLIERSKSRNWEEEIRVAQDAQELYDLAKDLALAYSNQRAEIKELRNVRTL